MRRAPRCSSRRFSSCAARPSSFPAIDLAASALFLRSRRAASFWQIARRSGSSAPRSRISPSRSPWPRLAVLIAVAREVAWRGLDWRAGAFLLLALAVGPGLVVNVRVQGPLGPRAPGADRGLRRRQALHARPSCRATSARATAPSRRAIRRSDSSWSAPDFLSATPRRRRLVIGAALVALGAVIGLARMAQGGHFLSDVVASGFLVCATSWLLHRWIVRHDGLGALVRDLRSPAAGAAALSTPARRRRRAPSRRRSRGSTGRWRFISAAPIRRCAASSASSPTFGVSTGYLVVAALVGGGAGYGGAAHSGRGEAAQARAQCLARGLCLRRGGRRRARGRHPEAGVRPRPPAPLDLATASSASLGMARTRAYWSFPSGHAITIVALAAALVVIERAPVALIASRPPAGDGEPDRARPALPERRSRRRVRWPARRSGRRARRSRARAQR